MASFITPDTASKSVKAEVKRVITNKLVTLPNASNLDSVYTFAHVEMPPARHYELFARSAGSAEWVNLATIHEYIRHARATEWLTTWINAWFLVVDHGTTNVKHYTQGSATARGWRKHCGSTAILQATRKLGYNVKSDFICGNYDDAILSYLAIFAEAQGLDDWMIVVCSTLNLNQDQ